MIKNRDSIPNKVRIAVKKRDKVRRFCGATKYLEVHELKPQSLGGTPTVDDCTLMCNDCHTWLHKNNKCRIGNLTQYSLDKIKAEIATKGFYITQNGNNITSLGRQLGSRDKKPRKKIGYYERTYNTKKYYTTNKVHATLNKYL